MKYSTIIRWGFLIGIFSANVHALPKYGVSNLASPNTAYVISLSDTSTPYNYELKIFRHKKELAHYPFQGELVSAYWSPLLKFVAINNHYGHGGIRVWVISLSDGSIITSHGSVRDRKYDRYLDEDYFFYLPRVADAELRTIYPGIDADQLREGYTSVAYGWKGNNQLLMFHELAYDNFCPNQNVIIQAFSTWNVADGGIKFKRIEVRKARDDEQEPMPPEVKKTLNFIP